MISIKDYAKSKDITYEAVRQQIVRYRDELGEHIIKNGKTQFLDDVAMAFLDGKRAESPIIVYEQNKDDAIKQLTDENKALLLQLTTVQQQLAETQQQLIQALPKLAQADEAQKMLEAEEKITEAQKSQIETLQETITYLKSDIITVTNAAEMAETERKNVEDKLEKMQKRSLWQRIRNKS